MSLAFAVPEVFDPQLCPVEQWVRKMKNYLGSVKPVEDQSYIFEFVFDRLSTTVQYWFEKVYSAGKKVTRSKMTAEALFGILIEEYGKRDLFASRDLFWKLPNGDISMFLSSFAEHALCSYLEQEELIYILSARLPSRLNQKLRENPPKDLHTALTLVRRLDDANAVARPAAFGKGKEGGKWDGNGSGGHGSSGGSGGTTVRLGAMSLQEIPAAQPLIAKIAGENTRATLDVGLEENLISWKMVRERGLRYSRILNREVRLPNGQMAASGATCELDVEHRGTSATLVFQVVEGVSLPVLGKPWQDVSS